MLPLTTDTSLPAPTTAPTTAPTAPQALPDPALVSIAADHVADILSQAIEHGPAHTAIVVSDHRCCLAATLTEAYRLSLPEARFIDFDEVSPEVVLAEFARLKAGDLVVLIQSTNFRLEAFRIRVELFKRGLKVVEHPHLIRMTAEEVPLYIDALAYDKAYLRTTGQGLKARIDQAQGGVIDSGNGAKLEVSGGFEPAKLNVGDYRQMKNVGGQFPIGEVFTEALDLESLRGQVRISSFGDRTFSVNFPPEPITLLVEGGRVVGTRDSTPEFDTVLETIRAEEGQIWVRELGFGLNRAFTQTRTVTDIGTYERMCGIHLSLGSKHMSYDKPQIKRTESKYHVDVFVLTDHFTLDGKIVYQDGAWQP